MTFYKHYQPIFQLCHFHHIFDLCCPCMALCKTDQYHNCQKYWSINKFDLFNIKYLFYIHYLKFNLFYIDYQSKSLCNTQQSSASNLHLPMQYLFYRKNLHNNPNSIDLQIYRIVIYIIKFIAKYLHLFNLPIFLTAKLEVKLAMRTFYIYILFLLKFQTIASKITQ